MFLTISDAVPLDGYLRNKAIQVQKENLELDPKTFLCHIVLFAVNSECTLN